MVILLLSSSLYANRMLICILELSIAPQLNERLVPPHARAALAARGIDLNNFVPMTKEEMIAKLD